MGDFTGTFKPNLKPPLIKFLFLQLFLGTRQTFFVHLLIDLPWIIDVRYVNTSWVFSLTFLLRKKETLGRLPQSLLVHLTHPWAKYDNDYWFCKVLSATLTYPILDCKLLEDRWGQAVLCIRQSTWTWGYKTWMSLWLLYLLDSSLSTCLPQLQYPYL